jgi:hypothetical protein
MSNLPQISLTLDHRFVTRNLSLRTPKGGQSVLGPLRVRRGNACRCGLRVRQGVRIGSRIGSGVTGGLGVRLLCGYELGG